MKLPPDLRENGWEPAEDEFDLKAYFAIFDRLQMEPGHELDWIYAWEELTGRPVLYARKQDGKRFRNEAEWLDFVREDVNLDEVDAAHAEYFAKLSAISEDDPLLLPPGMAPGPESNRSIEEHRKQREAAEKELEARLARFPRWQHWKWWREQVRTDGSSQAWLELAALYLLADQFALFWHANTDDHQIIADEPALERLVEQPVRDGSEGPEFLPPDVAAKALRLDPTPKVRILGRSVEVSLLTFTKWGGFERKKLTISRNPPHKLEAETTETEVAWDCGVVF